MAEISKQGLHKDFSQRLRALLGQKGLLKDDRLKGEAAAILGVSLTSLYNYLKSRLPEADKLAALAQGLEVSVDYLLFGDEVSPGPLNEVVEAQWQARDGRRVIREYLEVGSDPDRWVEFTLEPGQTVEDLPQETHCRAALAGILRQEFQGDEEALAQRTGLEAFLVFPVILGKINLPAEKWDKLARGLGYSVSDLADLGQELLSSPMNLKAYRRLMAQRSRLENAALARPPQDNQDMLERFKALPIYDSDRLAAGSGAEPYEDRPDDWFYLPPLELGERRHHRLICLRVGGDSMDPTYPRGSTVIVDLDENRFANDCVYALKLTIQEPPVIAIKRVRRLADEDEAYVLISDNPEAMDDPSGGVQLVHGSWGTLCLGRVIGGIRFER